MSEDGETEVELGNICDREGASNPAPMFQQNPKSAIALDEQGLTHDEARNPVSPKNRGFEKQIDKETRFLCVTSPSPIFLCHKRTKTIEKQRA
jgi:aspartate/methionine/tyrosine aminotransferase